MPQDKKVKTKVDGLVYEETCTLQELIEWSNGRWNAGQHEAALNVEKRAKALAEVELKSKDYLLERDDEGKLVLVVNEKPTTPPADTGKGGGS